MSTKVTDYNNHHIGEASDACSSESSPSSPDYSKLNLDPELLQKLAPDTQTPEKPPLTDMLFPILPYGIMQTKWDCPDGKVPVCCTVYGKPGTLPSFCKPCK